LAKFGFLDAEGPTRLAKSIALAAERRLATRPIEKDLEKWGVGLKIMTLAAHEKQIFDRVGAAQRSSDNVAPLERDSIPAA
jgi:hypothetical protein